MAPIEDDGLPLFLAEEDGINAIDLSRVVPRLDELPPVRKMLLMIMILSMKDRASEVRLTTSGPQSGAPALGLSYVVEGQAHDLVPPPEHLAGPIFEELKALGGLGNQFCFVFGNTRQDARLIVAEHALTIDLGEDSANLADRASEALTAFFAGRNGDGASCAL